MVVDYNLVTVEVVCTKFIHVRPNSIPAYITHIIRPNLPGLKQNPRLEIFMYLFVWGCVV